MLGVSIRSYNGFRTLRFKQVCLICTGCQRLNSFGSLNWKHFPWENMKIIQEEQYIAFHVRGIEDSFDDPLNVIWKYQSENQNHNPMKVDTTLLIWDTSVIWYKLYKYTSSFEMSVGKFSCNSTTLGQQNTKQSSPCIHFWQYPGNVWFLLHGSIETMTKIKLNQELYLMIAICPEKNNQNVI